MGEAEEPVLSVVVAIVCDTIRARSDATYLEGSLESLARQEDAPPMEVIVPYHPRIRGIERARERFPWVRFLPVNDLKEYKENEAGREHHDELRSRGLAAARGRIVAMLEDHGRAAPRWCANIVRAYERRFAGVGGAIENSVDRPLNWAVYFCDFGRYQNPVPAGEALMISDANASYKRSELEAVRSSWAALFNQVEVNGAIRARSQKLGIFPDIVIFQHREGLGLKEALAERYVWGRSFASSRVRWIGGVRRAIHAFLTPVLPAVLVARMTLDVMKKGRLRGAFLKALPLTVLLSVSWSAGELAGYLTGSARMAR
ncbi:MAG: hypothetical protein KIT09_02310 [Bryobacteraceae bacterium]|nr:hypothetical protein [Bryobacteraceae bacterium]